MKKLTLWASNPSGVEKTLQIYTDGGCTRNPGPGGWAAIIIASGYEPYEISGSEASTTNNRMELTAVTKALELVNRDFSQGQAIEVFTDSQYVQLGISEWMSRWISKGWKTRGRKPVKNKDLWLRLKEVSTKLNIEWKWIRGHSGNMWNERCDELVARERAKFF